MGKIVLVTGGARSGKSSFAEKYIKEHGHAIAYIATAQILDEEMQQRINEHQKRRSSDWHTAEAPFEAEIAINACQKYDAILFDVDGTLIDSAPGIIHTLQEVFCTMGVDVSGVNLRRYLGPPLRKSFGEHFTDPALIEKATDLYRTSYAVKGSHECAVFPGVLQMLQTLKQAGFILCTATSKPTKVVTPILEEQGLAQYFDFIGGASMDESRDTKTEVVRYVLSQPALQGKRVLMVGDRNDDMRGAADCGLDAAGVLYGYGSREELEAFHPVLLAESCADLTDRLLAARV